MLEKVPGVAVVIPDEGREGISSFRIESETGADTRSAVARAVVTANMELIQLRDIAMTLEDIFIKVTMN